MFTLMKLIFCGKTGPGIWTMILCPMLQHMVLELDIHGNDLYLNVLTLNMVITRVTDELNLLCHISPEDIRSYYVSY